MTNGQHGLRPGDTMVQQWRRFWFRPEPSTTLGIVRISFGLVMIGWTLALRFTLLDLFGNDSVAPNPAYGRYEWGLLEIAHDDRAVVALWLLLLLSAIGLTLGWHSRIAALGVFVCVMSFERAGTFVFNSGDSLLRLEALFMLLAPCGAALSLDRRRTVGSFWSAQVRAPWVLRLMQVQLSIIYIFSVLNKLAGQTWRDGTAVSYALQMSDIGNFIVPSWLTGNSVLMNVATWGALLLEICIGVFVWNRRARPWLLSAGVVMHLTMMTAMALAFFSFAMFVLYLAFVDSDTAERWVVKVRSLRQRQAEPREGSVMLTPPARSDAPAPRSPQHDATGSR